MKRIFLCTTLYVLPSLGLARDGHESGNTGGTLARLLSTAHSEILETLPKLKPGTITFYNPKLYEWYEKNYPNMKTDIEKLTFQSFSGPIYDSGYGYETWIRLKDDESFVVEYDPDVEKYNRLVGIINLEYRRTVVTHNTPHIADVTEYLLHEIGHKYKLKEHDAWQFAQAALYSFRFTQPIIPIVCKLQLPIGPSQSVEKEVTVDSNTEKEEFTVGKYKYRIMMNDRFNSMDIDAEKAENLERVAVLTVPTTPPIFMQIKVDEHQWIVAHCKTREQWEKEVQK